MSFDLEKVLRQNKGFEIVKYVGGIRIDYKGKRIGRDIEIYKFMARVAGPGRALVYILEELVIGLPRDEAYYEALRELGRGCLTGVELEKYLAVLE